MVPLPTQLNAAAFCLDSVDSLSILACANWLLSDRDKMLKLLVDLLSSSSKDLVISTLRLTHLLMLKYDWRVSFATEGGVKSILSCMQEFSSVTQVQQLALAVSDIHHQK